MEEKSKVPTLVGAVFLLLVVTLGLSLFSEQPRHRIRAGRHRIIAHSPALAEILFRIGAGDQVVGVSQFCQHPTEALELPKIGGVRVNLEQVHALKASDIFMQGQDPKLAAYCQSQGIDLREFKIETVAELFEAMRALGKITSCEKAAELECRRLERAFAEQRRQSLALRPSWSKQPPRVLISIGRSPGRLSEILTNSAGFLVECIEACGVKNLFSELEAQYPRLSLEAIVDRDPDFILEIQGIEMSEEQQSQLKKDWQALPSLSAVKNQRVLVIAGESLLIPGPRVTELLDEAQSIFPVEKP